MAKTSEDTVVVYRTTDELKAQFIISVLKENGIESMIRVPQYPVYDGMPRWRNSGKLGEIVVLESDFEKARELIKKQEG